MMSGRNGLKIILGVAPVTVLAAFIEGFLTRHTEIPNPIRFAFILLSFGFVLTYFFWYPRRVAKKTKNIEEITEQEPSYHKSETFNKNKILSFGDVLTQSLRLMFKSMSKFMLVLAGCSLVYAAIIVSDKLELFSDKNSYGFGIPNAFNFEKFPFLGLLSGIIYLIVIVLSLIIIQKKLTLKHKINVGKSLLSSFLFLPIFIGIIFIDDSWIKALGFFILPLLIFITTISALKNFQFFKAVGWAARLLNRKWFFTYGLFLVFWIFNLLLFYALSSLISLLFIDTSLIWAITDNEQTGLEISLGIHAFITCFSFLFYLALSVVSSCVLYFSLNEIYSAENLIHKIRSIKAIK